MNSHRIVIILAFGLLSLLAVIFPFSSGARAPEGPLNLVAWDSGDYVQLSWDNEAGTNAGYNIYRATKTPEHWQKLNEKPFALTTFVDYSVPRAELVYYRVNQVTAAGAELPSAAVIQISTTEPALSAQTTVQTSFDKNNIITDAQLINANTMSAADIQSFLASKGSVLANFSSGGKTAAQRIYDDCQTHGINPRVVLVTLQKEKGLITSSTANPNNLAMGWNTNEPTTTDFANQIYFGTRQFRRYYDDLAFYNWTVGQPHAVSDGTVTAVNTATAGLYIYTPWIGQGGGGQTGVGGNYLFWDLWYNSFGFGDSPLLTTAFPATVITSRTSTSAYATTKNAFWVSDHSLAGQCTWYAYGRVIELAEAGYLDPSAATIMHDAFWGKSGRDAKNWPAFLGGQWTSTNSAPLPLEKRQPGMLAVWPYGDNGHVGFVEEISADKTQYRLSDFNRGLDQVYRNVWYNFAGSSDLLLGGFPSFYQLPLPASSGTCSSASATLRNRDNGPPIHPPGSLLKSASSATVYLIDGDNKKRPITSAAVLAQLYNQSTDARTSTNFSSWVITVGQDELDLYEQGGNLSAAQPGNGKLFPDGKLISANGEVSIVTGGGKRRPFVSSSTFTGLGFDFCQVVNLTSTEYNSYPVGPAVEAMPLLTSSVNLNVGSTATVGQSVSGSFTIKNVGTQSLPLSSLGIGGRLNGNPFDISFTSTTLSPGQSFTYNSQSRQLTSAGTYTFFAAYQENNTHWATSVPASSSVTRSRTVTVSSCTFSITPSSQNFGPAGGFGSVSVTANSGCSWTATSNSSFITITSGGSGSGNGTVNYTVAENTTQTQRSGTMTIAGKTFTVTQDPAPSCSFSISPQSQNFGSPGGFSSVNVTAGPGCSWTATSNSSFITITSGSSGSGSGSVNYTVAENTSPNQRSGSMTIAGQPFTVTQDAAPSCSFSISPQSQNFGSPGGFSSVNVTAGPGCSWTATSNSSFITITSGSSGSGSGSVNYTVAENTSPNQRSGSMTIAGQPFTVTQDPAPSCSFSISPQTQNFASSGGTGSVNITAGAGCSWIAASNDNFITITSGSSGSGSGTVNYSVAAHTGTSMRFGTMTIAGQSFTVTQDAPATPSNTNVALAANGATASASSTLNTSYLPGNAINGERAGANSITGGVFNGWISGSPTMPQWVQVDFGQTRTIVEIDVFMVQDNYQNPSTPNQNMTFTTFGLNGFDVQYWNGSSWVTVSGGSVSGNNKVWRQFTFPAISTSRIRVLTNASPDNYSRLTEIEAWTSTTTPPPSSAINVALPGNGATASASSTLSTSYLPGNVINGERAGANSTTGGVFNGWISNQTMPQWLQIDFGQTRTIVEIDVFMVQDNYQNPSSPNQNMIFTTFGLYGFDVQYWNGSSWVTVPNGSVSGNNKVWRQFTFPAISTSRIRVLTNASPDNYSRLTEVEAWTSTTTPPPSGINVALPGNGGVASASSTSTTSYLPGNAINGERAGANSTTGGVFNGWISNQSMPQWLQIDFGQTRSIFEIDVFMVQDNYQNPSPPTPEMTFSTFGLFGFDVQYWNGSSWVTVPGGSVSGNNKVWRQFTFPAISTSRIRVLTNASPDNYSRLTEVEAWSNPGPIRP